MTRVSYTNGKVVDPAVIDIWEDLGSERPGMFRAFWVDGPNATSGSPVVGYCSPGGSHRTIREVIAECRKLGHTDPIYRKGKLISPAVNTTTAKE